VKPGDLSGWNGLPEHEWEMRNGRFGKWFARPSRGAGWWCGQPMTAVRNGEKVAGTWGKAGKMSGKKRPPAHCG